MNVVLYTINLEPLTIIDLPIDILEKMEVEGALKILVAKPPKTLSQGTLTFPMPETITLYCQRLRWLDDSIKTVIFTEDEELALAIKPGWLPGQTANVQHYKGVIKHLNEQILKVMRKN
jgi:hypothetical protein